MPAGDGDESSAAREPGADSRGAHDVFETTGDHLLSSIVEAGGSPPIALVTVLAEILLAAAAALGAAVCIALLPRGRRPGPARTPPPTGRPAQLEALERLVSSAGASAVHTHAYLRPVLAEIATQRLAVRGRALNALPDPEGRELLGDALWELVRPERPFPEDRYGPGISRRQLDAMLTTLEGL